MVPGSEPQGHSVKVDLQLKHRRPPVVFYHGTVREFLQNIQKHGLVRGRRHTFTFSPSRHCDRRGGRRGRAVVLGITAARMVATGHRFFCSENGVWLVDQVPPEFVRCPAS